MAELQAQEIEWPIFESLFVHALKPTGEFAEALKDIGLDLAKPTPRYPSKVFDDSLNVASRFVYPSLPIDKAHYELGVKVGESFFDTLIGQVMGVAMPLIGPDRVLASMPKRVKVGGSGGCTVEKLAERTWRVVLLGPGSAQFAAGAFAASLVKCKVTPVVAIEKALPDRNVFKVTW